MNKDLTQRLLASIELHGKCDITGIYHLYPHEKKISVLRSLIVLRDDGWLIIRKTRMDQETRVNRPNVRRSKKQMYTQAELL